MAKSALRWKALGKHFGYPECCVDEFLATTCQATKDQFPVGPWHGTGFIPCLRCADSAIAFDQFIATRITPQRRCSTPFPETESDAVTNEVVYQAFILLPLRARLRYWLDSVVERIRYELFTA